MMDRKNEIGSIEEEIKQIQASLPAHSTPPAILLRLEELEEKLAALLEEEEHAAD